MYVSELRWWFRFEGLRVEVGPSMIVRRLRRVKQIGNMHASPPASACLLAFEVEDEGPALRRDREQVPAGSRWRLPPTARR